jgi:transposase, IS30 family
MGKYYKQLSLEERCTISSLQKEGQSVRQIAAALARSPSTIAREINRNITQSKGYEPSYAQLQTAGRRWQGSQLERKPALRTAVLDLLAMGWSPQQVANRLSQEQGCKVISYESIYRFIYAQLKRTKEYKWRQYLPRAKSYRGWRGRKGGSSVSFIKERVSISKRPSSILKRKKPGHWEADLMLFSTYGQAILVAHERYSRLLMLFKLPSKEAKLVMSQLMELFKCLPRPLAKTVTFDNGTEFSEHYQLKTLGIRTYFCDVRSPWQKGGIENAIGRLRRPLPRKTDLDKLKNKDIEKLVGLYNHTPRKCLGYKTPAEIFVKQLLHFKCEFTFPPSRE